MAGKGKQGMRTSKAENGSSPAKIDFAIITAIKGEREAVCQAFGLTPKNRSREGARVYWRGRVPLKNSEYYEIVVAQSPDMAQVDAAILTNDTIHHWDPAALLMVGVAGAASDGTKEDDEALGDLVLGSDVQYYERGKMTADGKKHEPYMYKADATLWNNVTTMPPMRSRIPVSRPDGKQTKPVVHQGVIASGEKVIADAAVRDEIASGHRKTRAIEMEGYGFSAAVWQSAGKRHHLVMKAICDRADRAKDQNWQPYAAAVAAQYAKHFLRDRPLEPRNQLSSSDGQGDDDEDVGSILRRQEKIEQEQRHTREEVTRMQARLDQFAFGQASEDVQVKTTTFDESSSHLLEEINMDEKSESWRIGEADPTSDTIKKALTMRINDLNDNITRDFALLKEYEDEFRLEDDPGRRAKYQRQIEKLKTSARIYEQELRELESRKVITAPEVMPDGAAGSVNLHEKLDALLAGQSNFQQNLYQLRQTMLRRYDAGEQRIINVLTERMSYAQTQAVGVMLDAVEKSQFDTVEINEFLSLVSRSLTEKQEHDVALPERDELVQIISAPHLDVKHKLKLTIPIIPLLLTYEGEVASGNGMNLEALWGRLVDKVLGK